MKVYIHNQHISDTYINVYFVIIRKQKKITNNSPFQYIMGYLNNMLFKVHTELISIMSKHFSLITMSLVNNFVDS